MIDDATASIQYPCAYPRVHDAHKAICVSVMRIHMRRNRTYPYAQDALVGQEDHSIVFACLDIVLMRQWQGEAASKEKTTR